MFQDDSPEELPAGKLSGELYPLADPGGFGRAKKDDVTFTKEQLGYRQAENIFEIKQRFLLSLLARGAACSSSAHR